MENKIVIAQDVLDMIANREKVKAIKDNHPSHIYENNFRSVVFNLKSFVSKIKAQEQVLYIPINIPKAISQVFADFVCGKAIDIEISNEKLQTVWNDFAKQQKFSSKIHNLVSNQSLYGYGVLRRRRKEGTKDKFLIEHIPFNYYYPELKGLYVGEDVKQFHIISPAYVQNNTKMNKTVKVQSYKYENEKRILEEGIYEQDLMGNLTLSETGIVETTDFRSAYILDNDKDAGEFVGSSDFFDVMDLIEELNDRLTQISVQFIKHLNAKMSVPYGMRQFLEKNEKGMDEMELLVHKDGETPAKYVENPNLMLGDAMTYAEKIMRLISAITKTPVAFLGLEEAGGAEKVEAIKMRMSSFFQKVYRKREALNDMIEEFVKDTLKHMGHSVESVNVNIKYTEVDITDEKAFFEKIMTMYDKSLLSGKSAMGYSMDWDDEAVEAEQKIIDEEKQKAIQEAQNNPLMQNNQDNQNTNGDNNGNNNPPVNQDNQGGNNQQ